MEKKCIYEKYFILINFSIYQFINLFIHWLILFYFIYYLIYYLILFYFVLYLIWDCDNKLYVKIKYSNFRWKWDVWETMGYFIQFIYILFFTIYSNWWLVYFTVIFDGCNFIFFFKRIVEIMDFTSLFWSCTNCSEVVVMWFGLLYSKIKYNLTK